ncbi:transducin beta-like protein 3 [Episyrphus balteatus]|uniref:transducin beta-like protein 3 n=1 Tax=Episyrphus balteatus TaxID=286459 RepID=UPI00248527AD|nr:transducin beta-like protein 3 [Episyrphus balteatus]
MATNIKLKEAFEAESQFGAFYTGGIVAWTSSGDEFLCQDVGKINVINIDSGNIVNSIGEEKSADVDEDVVYTFALSADDEHVLTAHKSGLLKMWEKKTGTLEKMWKSAHKGPVARLAFRSRGNVVASGGSDASIRIWDYERKTCLCAFRDSQGVVALVVFHPDIENNLVFGSGDDNKINCWDYATRTHKVTFTGHYSKVTALSFDTDSKIMASVSRDKVLILWNIETGAQIKVLPLYEGLEGVCILPKTLILPNGFDLAAAENKDKTFAAVAGENGYIRVWNCSDAKNIYTQTNSSVSKASEDGGLAVTQLLQCNKTNQLAMVTADHNIIVHNTSTFHCAKQLIGFSDEILDVCFVGKNSRFLAVATNSSDIKFYDTSNMNCSILKGHSDIVLALSSHKNFLLSSSKDNTIRIWEMDSGSFTVKCVAKGTKHTSSVGSVAFGKMSHTICASASQDTCLKVWEVPKTFSNNSSDEVDLHSLVCTNTAIAHEKDVNCVAISPNDLIVATASQDKTAKLWDSKTLSLLGVLRGHRRGVWCVRFSPIDQILLTTSADCSLRMWSLTDMTCLKTIEGHESSVLRAEFISKGMQLVSAGGDGLIKLWNIKNSECTLTLDKHEARIWTLAVAHGETHFFSGGADSKLIRWKDVTEEKKLAEIQERQEMAAQEQELNNLIAQKKMLKALRLALKLEKPYLTLKIINTVIKNGESGLPDTIKSLNELHKESLMRHAVSWNTNSRNCRPAQLVLNILINLVLANEFKPSGMGKMIEETLPYTERHFKRMTEYLKDLKFIEFTLKCMQPHGGMEVDVVDK